LESWPYGQISSTHIEQGWSLKFYWLRIIFHHADEGLRDGEEDVCYPYGCPCSKFDFVLVEALV
jgi:hypothetical protein